MKELASRQIRQNLSKCDIAEELFSKYSSWSVVPSLESLAFLSIDRYPELRELELRQLARVLLSSDSGPTLGALRRKIKSCAKGNLPHAEHVLPTLYELMESDESVEEASLPAGTSSDQPAASEDWDTLKKALTSSLASGTFLDSQFYAVESSSSKGSLRIRPIYFCSAVGGSLVPRLVACGFLTWVAHIELVLMSRSSLFETQDTESATSAVCRWIRQRYRQRKARPGGLH